MPTIIGGVLIIVLAFSAALAGLNSYKNTQYNKLHTEYTQLKLKLSEDNTKAHVEVRSTETVLSVDVAKERNNLNEKIQSLTSERNALLKRVRNAEANLATARLSKDATVTSTGSVAESSDGTELLNTIGEEDVEEASRADTIREHLLSCYRYVDRAEAALKSLNN